MNEFDIAVLSDALEKATKQYEGMILESIGIQAQVEDRT